MEKTRQGDDEKMDGTELEFNSPKERLLEHASYRIYEDKRIDEMRYELRVIDSKINKLISMLTAHDFSTKELMKK